MGDATMKVLAAIGETGASLGDLHRALRRAANWLPALAAARRDGLVVNTGPDGSSSYRLTDAGLDKLATCSARTAVTAAEREVVEAAVAWDETNSWLNSEPSPEDVLAAKVQALRDARAKLREVEGG